MADHTAPGYELADTLELTEPEQYRALFDDTRSQIVDLLMERAANIKELADALDKPKGTVGHHVGVLEGAGLIRVVRTEKIRAIVAKYYGRTARTFVIGESPDSDVRLAPDHFLTAAAADFAYADVEDPGTLSTLRYARIPTERAGEWNDRLLELAVEFTKEPRGGETTYGLLLAMFPTRRPHLPSGGPR